LTISVIFRINVFLCSKDLCRLCFAVDRPNFSGRLRGLFFVCPRNKVSGEVLVLGENDASDRKRIATAAIAAAFIFIVSSLVFMNSTYDQVKAEILASIRDVEKRNVALLRQNLLIKTLSTAYQRLLANLPPSSTLRRLSGLSGSRTVLQVLARSTS